MDFQGALTLLKAGKRVCRTGWNGADQFVYLVPGSTFNVNRAPLLGILPLGTPVKYLPHVDMKNAQGEFVPWQASQGDLLADDWEEKLKK